MAQNKDKCVLYARVSSREQEETGYSLDAQEKLLRQYAEKNGHVVTRVFRVSESASGAKMREEFSKMMRYLAEKKIHTLICEKTDRLTRSRKDAVIVDEWVREDENNQAHFVKENFVLTKDSRANEKFMWGIKVEVAQYYTNNLSEEVKKGQKEKIAQGWLPTKPPLGYKTVGEKGRKIHIIDEDNAPFVRRAFEYYASGSCSLMALRDKLYDEGLRTRGGYKLSKARLHEILGDPFYYGAMRWKDITYAALQEPLVSKELFDAVQAKMKGRGAPHHKRRMFKFTKMMKCGECGGTISGELHKGHVYYYCKHNDTCPQRAGTREEQIEKALMGVFRFFEGLNSEEADEIYRKIKADHQVEADYKANTLASLNRRNEALQRRLDVLYDDRLDETITQARWKEKEKEITDEQAEIQAQITRLKSEETKYFELYINVLDLARRAREIYEKRSPEERRMLLAHIFSNLTLKDKDT
ncbi:recombinase family protein, partial [Candidatus Kaiserbacteria bacterium]|nr:recombinase family protein [Candidatus Kaiserbacteria bacterium]